MDFGQQNGNNPPDPGRAERGRTKLWTPLLVASVNLHVAEARAETQVADSLVSLQLVNGLRVRVASVTAQDVHRVANTYLTPDHYDVALAGPSHLATPLHSRGALQTYAVHLCKWIDVLITLRLRP